MEPAPNPSIRVVVVFFFEEEKKDQTSRMWILLIGSLGLGGPSHEPVSQTVDFYSAWGSIIILGLHNSNDYY